MQARIDLDVFYVENASIALDLLILARTPLAVLGGRNAA
jgi:putative colanic acid biosynthesis UDP-glucose lipid carrier transferase